AACDGSSGQGNGCLIAISGAISATLGCTVKAGGFSNQGAEAATVSVASNDNAFSMIISVRGPLEARRYVEGDPDPHSNIDSTLSEQSESFRCSSATLLAAKSGGPWELVLSKAESGPHDTTPTFAVDYAVSGAITATAQRADTTSDEKVNIDIR